MTLDSLIDWLLPIVSGGGLGAMITYIFTFKSKKSLADAEAKTAQTKAEHDILDLRQDKYDYLQDTLDKYIKDYHELEQQFRDRMRELRDSMNEIIKENSRAVSEKCNEIAALKAQVTYLKGIRCYDFTCPKRVKENPDKSE